MSKLSITKYNMSITARKLIKTRVGNSGNMAVSRSVAELAGGFKLLLGAQGGLNEKQK